MAKQRADKLLVERGLTETRAKAQALIMAGKVFSADRRIAKAGDLVAEDAPLEVKGQDHPWVSRGGLKLAHALEHFALDPKGAVAIDVGASTGGFTDVLLRRGAARVYAIDVGYGQLAWSLRQDPRVVVLERQNARNMELALVPEPCDLAVIDVSFISLTLVLPRVAALLQPPLGKPIIALVKPQFEVGRGGVREGVVRDAALRSEAVANVLWAAFDIGLGTAGILSSPIAGSHGNREYLVHVTATSGANPSEWMRRVDQLTGGAIA